MAIPRKIFSIWLNDDRKVPPLIQKCIDSHAIPGYEHELLTLDNVFPTDEYLKDAIAAKDWVRAADFLRLNVLLYEGGIYMDADVEMVEWKDFDDMLEDTVFVSTEPTNFMIANTVIGAEPMSAFINDVLGRMVSEKKENVFEAGMGIFHEVAYHDLMGKNGYGIKVYPDTYFQPYNNHTGETRVTEHTRCMHYNSESWKEADLPTVSVLVPTLWRPEWLKRLLDSVSLLNYPSDKIELVVKEDSPRIGVPKRLKELYGKSTGEYVVFAANDTEFEPNTLRIAIREMLRESLDMLSLNTGPLYPDGGNANEHFAIRREFVERYLHGELFDTDFLHVGCDNYLLAQAKKYGKWKRSENAVLHHHHFSKGAPMDEVYELAYERAEWDREVLRKKLAELEGKR